MSEGPTAPLPYGRHLVDEDDVAAVVRVLRSERLTSGPAVEAFEEAFAARLEARFAVSCSSGTAALHLAAMALGLGPGDAVIVPTLTVLATANAVRHVGAEVVFADIDTATGLMTAETLRAALRRAEEAEAKPRAVFPVHLNGQCVDSLTVAAIGEDDGLRVVEDSCHMLGGVFDALELSRQPVGSCAFADMAAFSLHPVKAIAMGEGGVVTTNDVHLRDRLSRLRNHGMLREPSELVHEELARDPRGDSNPWYYEMHELGLNYRASDIHCALGLSQLGKLDRFNRRRDALVACYDAALRPLSPLIRPIGRVPWCKPAWHLYVVHIDFQRAGLDRAELMRELKADGIDTQVHYLPVHLQPYYVARYGRMSLPGAEAYYRRALSLPLFPAMTEEDVDRVTAALARHCGT